MPRYFFDLHNSLDVYDEEGAELPDPTAARARAVLSVRELMAEEIQRHGRLVLGHRIEIRDAQRQVVNTVSFRDCVEVCS